MRARWRLGLVGSAIFLALLVRPVHADLSLDIQPARYEFAVDAGTSKTIPVTVRNLGTGPTHVVATLSDLAMNETGQVRFTAPGSIKYSAGRWSAVNPREFDLAPGAFQQVRYSVGVPSGARGEYTTLILFTTRPPRKPGGFGVAQSVASRMYVVAGDADPAGTVGRLTTEPNATGRAYSVTFANSGTMHVYVTGYVEVTHDGTALERLTLPNSTFVGRGSTRVLTALGKTLSAGSYSAVAVLDYGGATRVAGKTSFVVR